jgi:hypothetical protein
VTTIFETNNSIKHYFSVLTFYEKWQKSRFLSNSIICYFMHITSDICTKPVAHKQTFNNDNVCDKILEDNYFVKTLLFCANFLRKTTKISISDKLLTVWYFLCTPDFSQVLKTHKVKSFIIFIKTLLFCANFSWKMLKIVFSDEVLCNIWLCVTIIPKMCVVRTVQTLCKKVWKTMFYGQKTELCTRVFTQLCKMCKTCIKSVKVAFRRLITCCAQCVHSWLTNVTSGTLSWPTRWHHMCTQSVFYVKINVLRAKFAL